MFYLILNDIYLECHIGTHGDGSILRIESTVDTRLCTTVNLRFHTLVTCKSEQVFCCYIETEIRDEYRLRPFLRQGNPQLDVLQTNIGTILDVEVRHLIIIIGC